MISVICPTFNEEKFIGKILDFFVNSKPEDKELFIVDGGSKDKTCDIVLDYSRKHPNVYLLHNKNKYVPYAFNMGIDKAKGEYITIIGAHSEYSIDYFEKILETFQKVDADIVGGPALTKYNNIFQAAVGNAISSKFGTGDSKSHYANYTGYADSVTFGTFKREVFNEVGLFDTRLVRNQDDELFYRAKSMGKKLYLTPDIKLWYYPRDNIKGLFKQYFQYGEYKPLVLKKVKSEIKLRHLMPMFFTLYFLSLPLSAVSIFWLLPLAIYLLQDLIFSFRGNKTIKGKLISIIVYPAIHLGYGSGFIYGLYRLLIAKNY
ncbi:MAG TPA: glycosyltransferase family 2 protein [Ignavibacteriaceae bacterium]|nr:glycosyltransferase family 2 protein [Ignavibacteriaceae bacterium]